MRLQLSMFCMVLIAFWVPAPEANAGLSLGGFGNVTWDRSANSGTSPGYTLTVDTDGDSSNNLVTGFTIGIIAVPVGSATGTVSVGTPQVPSDNWLFTLFDNPHYNIASNTEPFPGVTAINIDHGSFGTDVEVTAEKNAIDVTFTSTDALGLFEIYAVGNYARYFDGGGGEYQFSNIDLDDSILLGTLNVVPEPSSLTALALVGGLVGFAKYRRRKRS